MNPEETSPIEQTGWPSPAKEFAEAPLDLHRFLVKNPAATYFFRLTEDAPEFRLFADDLLVLDRSLAPSAGALVMTVIEDQHVVRRYVIKEGRAGLFDGLHTIWPDEMTVLGVIRASVTQHVPDR